MPTGPVPSAEIAEACAAALKSSAFDGVTDLPGLGTTVVYGHRTVVKVQHRLHEQFETALRMEAMRERARVRVPALLDSGTVETPSGPRWWLVLERVDGSPGDRPTAARQRQMGEQLRRWHDTGEREGLRLDGPGALGVMLGSARTLVPHVYPALSRLLDEACAGQPVTAIHGDVAVGHNALFDGDDLLALFDPGAVEVGPPMLDLAWCLAVDLPRGTCPQWLLEGYGIDAVDRESLDALLPFIALRRMIDTRAEGPDEDARWLANWLAENAPDLLPLTAPAEPG
ncbi:phosphotransferase enzyme family protein [Streptosporangium sandarakinum]|uniref:phosphotransferase enzyme family protein n=1 Tax=Streptosporangium sandarakinum TaxID=1260955 RepID=UPI0033B58383